MSESITPEEFRELAGYGRAGTDSRASIGRMRRSDAEAGRAGEPRKTTRKYHNRPTVVDGVRYDSAAEAKRAEDLKLLRAVGEVVCWIRQPRIRLGEDIEYVADFAVWDNLGRHWFEDVKGVQTPRFRMIKKLWARYGPADLIILCRRDGGWNRSLVEGVK